MYKRQTVGYWANAAQYKDFLTLLHSWYEKGYLMKDFASMTQSEAQAMFDAVSYTHLIPGAPC